MATQPPPSLSPATPQQPSGVPGSSSLNVTSDQRAEVDNLVLSAEMLLPDLVALLGELASPTIGGAGPAKQALVFQNRLQQLQTACDALPGVDINREQQMTLYEELNDALQQKIALLEKYKRLDLLQPSSKVSNSGGGATQ